MLFPRRLPPSVPLIASAAVLSGLALYACSKKSTPPPGRVSQLPATSGSTATAGPGGAGGKAGAGGSCGGAGGMGGSSAAPPVKAAWATESTDSTASATAIAVDAKGDAIVAVSFSGGFKLGSITAIAPGTDILLIALDPTGMPLWHVHPASTGSAAITGIAIDAKGEIIIAGRYDQTLAIGTTALPAAMMAPAAFVAKLDATGNPLWARSFGDDGKDKEPTAVAVDKSGAIVVAGFFLGDIGFAAEGSGGAGGGGGKSGAGGGGGKSGAGGKSGGSCGAGGAGMGPNGCLRADSDNDIFLAKLDGSGQPVFAKRFGGPGNQLAWAVATDAAGDIAIAGSFDGTVDFSGGQQAPFSAQPNNNQAYVASFDPSGKYRWAVELGGTGVHEARGLAFDGNGDVLVDGYFSGTILLGQQLPMSKGDDDIFAAKLGGASGLVQWGAAFGDAQKQRALALAVTSKNELIAAGFGAGSTPFPPQQLASRGMSDAALVLVLDSTGAPEWGGAWGGDKDAQATVVAQSAGRPLIGGAFSGTLDFGLSCKPFTASAPNLFVAEIAAPH